MTSYQLVAIDLDGTLLDSQTHAISPTNADAVRRVHNQGIQIVLASGRRYATLVDFARQLDLPQETPLVAYNGALIRTLGGETWYHRPLPADLAAKIVREYQADHQLNYYLNDEWYSRQETAWSRLYQKRTGSIPHMVGDLTRFDDQTPTKILLIDTCEITDALLPKVQAEFGEALYITKTEDEYLEFMNNGVSKAVALTHVAERLGLDASQCVAFGDSYNDISMIKWAGLGIAMGNGRDELKQVADAIAPPADDDGVATMLSELFPKVREEQEPIPSR